MILTGKFIKLLSDDTSWTTGEDFGGDGDGTSDRVCPGEKERHVPYHGRPDVWLDLCDKAKHWRFDAGIQWSALRLFVVCLP